MVLYRMRYQVPILPMWYCMFCPWRAISQPPLLSKHIPGHSANLCFYAFCAVTQSRSLRFLQDDVQQKLQWLHVIFLLLNPLTCKFEKLMFSWREASCKTPMGKGSTDPRIGFDFAAKMVLTKL